MVTDYFFDIEWIEHSGRRADIISLGIVRADGREYYSIQAAAMPMWGMVYSMDPWVAQNIFVHLEEPTKHAGMYRCYGEMMQEVEEFTAHPRNKAKFWCYGAGYKWFLLCNLFTHHSKIPNNWIDHPFDLQLWHEWAGLPELPYLERRHHALDEAHWAKEVHTFLTALSGSPEQVFQQGLDVPK